jgi:hypothetical protein
MYDKLKELEEGKYAILLPLIFLLFLYSMEFMKDVPFIKQNRESVDKLMTAEKGDVIKNTNLSFESKSGTEMIVDFTLANNNSDFNIKGVSVNCTSYSELGTYANVNNKDITSIVAHNETIKIKNVYMGSLQTNAKFSCSIQNIDYERI